MKISNILALTLIAVLPSAPVLAEQSGKEVYAKTCAVCHASGIAGAPKYGNAADWAPRLAAGSARLYSNALKGTPKGMPPKGGKLSYSDAEVKSAVNYMMASVQQAASKEVPKAEAPTPAAENAEPLPTAAATTAYTPVDDANSFNRLLKPVDKRNPPPSEDGIHDPANEGTPALLPPLAAFAKLPKSAAGNRVNWVESLNQKKIKPRSDRVDVNAEPVVMDLNIVREVKGFMPDVVYPHKQHTEWLDCSNCHPAIFVPQKGANAISMASILLGEKCGVCHGKVAFPVSECRLCHSKKKDFTRPTQASASAAR